MGSLRIGFFDQDLAHVERLAGLDGEFLAKLRAVRRARRGAINDAIRRARDQRGEHDPALRIGRRIFLVVDRVDHYQRSLVGDQGAFFPRLECEEFTGCDDHRD
jgi:hypothetical protein